jgi:hypothetical protein
MQRSPLDPTAVSVSGPAPSATENQAQASVQPAPDISGAIVPVKDKKKKPNNGWTPSLELLVAEWADKAACYRWMHDKSSAKYGKSNLLMTFPVILLSTITGTASFGINGLLPDDPSYAKYAGAAIGVVSLMTALIQTIANTLRYAQQSEGHRVAGISWGKFQRFISIELSLHPDERMEAVNFLKMARIELDRLIEQSPAIPESVIREFEVEHRKKTDIKRPEIAGGVEHTRVFSDTKDSRLVKLAAEAAMMIAHKKKVMSELVVGELDKKIIDRAREEREKMDKELRAEMERVAREAAASAVLANSSKVPINSVALRINDDGLIPAAITLDIPPPNHAQQNNESGPPSLEIQNEEKKEERK